MKKTLIALTVVFLLGSLTTFAALEQFWDLTGEDTWYTEAVTNMASQGVIEGYPDLSFRPSEYVNRAQLAVILDRYTQNVLKEETDTKEEVVCTMELRSGISIILQDQNAMPISGARFTVDNGQISEQLDGNYSGLYEGEGYYTFTITKDGYSSHTETIKLEQDACHVITQTRTITLIEK